MGDNSLTAYLVYSDDLPPEGIFAIEQEPRDIVFAKNRGQARSVFCKLWLLPFTARLHIRIIERDVCRHEGHCAMDDDPIWAEVDPAFAIHLKLQFEDYMRPE